MYPYPSRWSSGRPAHPAPHRWRLGTLVLLVLLAAALSLLVWAIRTADQVSPATQPPAGNVTAAPRYPPGIEEEYYWNQGQPQPAPAE